MFLYGGYLLKWKKGSSFDAITLIRADEVKDDKIIDEGSQG
jgi:hypothetical protein